MRRYALVAIAGAIFLLLLYCGFQLKRGWRYGLRSLIVLIVGVGMLYGGYKLALRWWYGSEDADTTSSNMYIVDWLNDPRPELRTGQEHLCSDSLFMLPSEGFIGLLWRDPAPPYNANRRHTGIDIFGVGALGTVPVVAAYDGWLTRKSDWKSTVIIRHNDPLQPGRTIWTYYTHMADVTGTKSFVDAAFPKGTSETFVKQGTLLGYQGEYAGNASAIAMHVHMSIVLSDGDGAFLNEAIIDNTIDPSPYFDLALNIDQQPDRPIRCAK